MSTVDLVRATDLSLDDRQRWAALATNERWSSPFYRPEFHEALDHAAAVTGTAPVEVAIVRATADSTAFVPFQRLAPRRAVAAGWPLTDYQGAIGDLSLPLIALLNSVRLDELSFDHVPVDQARFAVDAQRVEPSPRIRMPPDPHGIDDRFRSNLEAGRRKIVARLGPLHFDVDDRTGVGLAAMKRWKSAQYLRTGKQDRFAQPLVNELVDRLVAADPAGPLRAVTSVLWADDRPIAAHLGLVAGTEWHYWFPAHDTSVPVGSPGSLLLREMCRHAGTLGVDVIDLGRGDQPYKLAVADEQRLVVAGRAVSSHPVSVLRRVARRSGRLAARQLRPQRR